MPTGNDLGFPPRIEPVNFSAVIYIIQYNTIQVQYKYKYGYIIKCMYGPVLVVDSWSGVSRSPRSVFHPKGRLGTYITVLWVNVIS